MVQFLEENIYMKTGTLEIHSENLLPIIKKWLYSEKDIFVRELVSNSCDAIRKLILLREEGLSSAKDDEFRIDVKIDKTARTLTFEDTGLGMDADEVVKYIAQLAFSGAEEFLKKYEKDDEKEQIIGHFGMGFYSAYMVAKRVEINSLSYKEGAEAAWWECDGSSEYQISEGKKSARGTEIILHLNEDEDEYLEESRLKEIMKKYSSFLPYPIYLNGEQINKTEPLWMKSPSECTEKDYIDFYRQLHPMEEDPFFWVHLNVDYPFSLKGILYFPHLKRDMDFSKHNINLYCNRVYVSDDCKDIVPEYLTMLKGVIDSPDIPLNVSRSYLQVDRTVRQLGQHISKKVSDKLSSLYRNEREKFIECWQDIEMIIKLGAIQDDKFYERVKEFLLWKNLDGEWTTVEEYCETHKEAYSNKIFYTASDHTDTHLLEMYQQKKIEVLQMNTIVDTHVMSFLEGKLAPVKFRRIDGAIDETIVDKSREKSLLDAEGKTEAGRLADFIRKNLDQEGVEVEAKSLSSDELPCFVMVDEDSRRMRDFMRATDRSGKFSLDGMSKKTLVVNTNNVLMTALPELAKKDAGLAKEVLREVYDLALISQRELEPKELNQFIKRTHQVLAALIK
jgi:molecular chaperone HtpG